MHPFGQSQSKIIAFSGNVDQSKPDSHYDPQIDPCLQQNATQMLGGKHSTQPVGELTKYKCLVPAQNRLPNALAEEVEGGLNNFTVRKTI